MLTSFYPLLPHLYRASVWVTERARQFELYIDRWQRLLANR